MQALCVALRIPRCLLEGPERRGSFSATGFEGLHVTRHVIEPWFSPDFPRVGQVLKSAQSSSTHVGGMAEGMNSNGDWERIVETGTCLSCPCFTVFSEHGRGLLGKTKTRRSIINGGPVPDAYPVSDEGGKRAGERM